MIVNRLAWDGFRNLQAGSLSPAPGVNLFYGRNAQGKTNLLEIFWFFTGGHSFRGAKDAETVTFGREQASLTMDFTAEGREQQAEIVIGRRRVATLNGVKQPAASRLAGHFCAVVFSPAHLALVRDGPESRRRFLDAAYCQLRPGYLRVLSDYQRALSQRNALLRELRCACGITPLSEQLAVWNDHLALTGARVFAARSAYVRRLAPAAAAIYAGIAGGKEELTLCYRSAIGDETVPPAEAGRRLAALLRDSEAADRAAGFSTVGPHRDDLEVTIAGQPARVYGSQGQQRSAVLALKLAEASILREETGEQPVALLDDVMSELDEGRQDYLLNHIHGWQVFVTCCDPSPLRRLTGEGRIFHVEAGVVTGEGAI